MLTEIYNDQGLELMHSKTNAGLAYRNFLTPDRLVDAIGLFGNNSNKKRFIGKVGPAYEAYTDVYTCGAELIFLREIQHRVIDKLYPDVLKNEKKSEKKLDPLEVCSTLVHFDPLQGMTSHRDYSYNRLILGTLVLSGEILYGSASTRTGAYDPKNIVLLERGDLALIKAPTTSMDKSMERPFFFMFSPTDSLISRMWVRDPANCANCHQDVQK